MRLMDDVAAAPSKKAAAAPLDELSKEEYLRLKQHHDNLAPGVQKAERKRLRAEMARYELLHPELVPPAAGYVGFWAILIGIIIPLLSSIGIVLCVIALIQAITQNRPIGGYTIAGLVIGALALAAWTPILLRML